MYCITKNKQSLVDNFTFKKNNYLYLINFDTFYFFEFFKLDGLFQTYLKPSRPLMLQL